MLSISRSSLHVQAWTINPIARLASLTQIASDAKPQAELPADPGRSPRFWRQKRIAQAAGIQQGLKILPLFLY